MFSNMKLKFYSIYLTARCRFKHNIRYIAKTPSLKGGVFCFGKEKGSAPNDLSAAYIYNKTKKELSLGLPPWLIVLYHICKHLSTAAGRYQPLYKEKPIIFKKKQKIARKSEMIAESCQTLAKLL